MRRSGMAVLVVLAWTCSVQGRSKDAETAPLPGPLNLSRVALFKNGFGFFVGQASLSADGTESSFLLPAVPVHGTFWLSYPADVNLVSVVTEKVRSKGELLEAITIPEILKANVGRRVRITLDEKPISGRIAYFTEDRRCPDHPALCARRPRDRRGPPGDLASLMTPDSCLSTRAATRSASIPANIDHVAFPDGKIQRHFARTRDAVAIHVRAAEPVRDRSLTVSFLAKGIAWTPSYLVDLVRPEKGDALSQSSDRQ